MAKTDKSSPDIESEVQSRYKAAREHASQWREQAKECFEFYSGRHWSEDEIAKLNAESRPPIVFNKAAVLIDAILGYETNNRSETRYIPRTLDDAGLNEMITGAADFFRDQCDAEYHESDAFRDSMICGMGWSGDRLSDESNAEYDLIRERVDPFEMLWDPSSQEPNLADARYIFRKKMFDREEVEAMFPDWDGETGSVDWLLEDDWESASQVNDDPRSSYKTESGDEGNTRRNIPVIEYQYKDKEKVYIVAGPQGPIEITPEQYKEKRDEIEAAMLKVAPKQKTIYKRCFIIGGRTVKEDIFCPHGFSYHCVTGKRDRNKGYWLGMMAALLDPQKWKNKWLSQILHILNTSAKPGYDVEKSAISNMSEFLSNASKPGAVNVFEDGALQNGRATYRNPAPMPSGHEKLLEYADQSFQDVTGVNQELLGMADREQAGVLEWQRKQSAVTLLAPLFDSLRRYRKMAGRTWLYLMTQYMSDGRLIRITQDDKEQTVPFDPRWREEDVTRYDVIVDQAASAPNQKEATWQTLQTLFPLLKEALPPPIMLTLLKYSPMPESLVTKIEQQIQAMPPPPDPEQQKLEVEKQKIAMQMQAKQEELKLKAQESEQERQIELQKAQLEMQIMREKAQLEIQVQAMKADADIQTQQRKMAFDAERMELEANNTIRMKDREFEAENQRANDKAKVDYGISMMKAGKGPDGSQIDLSKIFGSDKLAQGNEKMMQLISSLQSQVKNAEAGIAELKKPRKRNIKIIRDPKTNRATGAEEIST